MKNILLFFTALLFASFTNVKPEQNIGEYFPGGIISLNNDTVQAQILLENITKMQNRVRFIDAGGKKKSFKPGMINGFFLQTEGGKMVFESRSDINLSAFPSRKGQFYYRVSNDIYPLYYYVTTKMENTGVESELMEVRNYLIQVNLRWYLFTRENFEECTRIFSDNRPLVNDIEAGKYEFSQFPDIVDRYCASLHSRDN